MNKSVGTVKKPAAKKPVTKKPAKPRRSARPPAKPADTISKEIVQEAVEAAEVVAVQDLTVQAAATGIATAIKDASHDGVHPSIADKPQLIIDTDTAPAAAVAAAPSEEPVAHIPADDVTVMTRSVASKARIKQSEYSYDTVVLKLNVGSLRGNDESEASVKELRRLNKLGYRMVYADFTSINWAQVIMEAQF